ncbi:enoyl-CoA hydratase/isomerase family protein [Aromatoleum toluclasticum]|uniref:enoyl-CoA hydratase/isomerase family protein n=1 Tax=Aromatoleum toluclasticum TaxID=92003 RepID=UPI001D17D885|nr:enoyl-CoA hydratase-related protein [Aromatoleum toluclasticum]MCC4113957.1 enoyl-CoA hydratase/isomerase family protein [Aromatoleum toluclasticum]
MNNTKPVILDFADEVITIKLNRPDALNALDLSALLALNHAILEAANTPGARAVILRGEGCSFCAGGDVAAMHANRSDLPAYINTMIESFHSSVMALRSIAMPVIASVHGSVAGGGISLALACDMVLAARGTRFVTAYAQLGSSTDGGLSFWLTQRLGAARAFELLTLKSTMTAEDAMEMGLVNRVIDIESLDVESQRCARALAAMPRQAITEIKSLTTSQRKEDLLAQLAREKAAFLRCAATPEFAACVEAFMKRRF